MTCKLNIRNCLLQIILPIIVSATPSYADDLRIAFGSCLQQRQPAPIFSQILKWHPNVFIFLGDNIYAATENMGILEREYKALTERPEFIALRKMARVEAIWDDNDYGLKDGGADYPLKGASKKRFLDAFEVPQNDPRRVLQGIYTSFFLPGQVQVILLDTRFFRSPLTKAKEPPAPGHGQYVPNSDPELTVLGSSQWDWLKGEFDRKARLRVIASSIQFLSDKHGFECWGNFPAQRNKLLTLIEETPQTPVVIISGDRHHGEISRMELPTSQELYEVTSSSLNMTREPGEEPSSYRIGERLLDSNFGEIEMQGSDIKLRLVDVKGTVRNEVSFTLPSAP
jgi:alkaline phosphatase D